MKKCKSCNKEIAKNAKVCPDCGAEQRNWFMRHKVMSFLIALILIFAISTVTKKRIEKNTKPDYSVTNAEIVEEFTENEAKAKEKYDGKIVEITGKVDDILVTGETYQITLDSGINQDILSGNYDFEKELSISVFLNPENNDQAKDVKKGQKIKVKGKLNNAVFGFDLEDAIIL